jgi:hypothetical protein
MSVVYVIFRVFYSSFLVYMEQCRIVLDNLYRCFILLGLNRWFLNEKGREQGEASEKQLKL